MLRIASTPLATVVDIPRARIIAAQNVQYPQNVSDPQRDALPFYEAVVREYPFGNGYRVAGMMPRRHQRRASKTVFFKVQIRVVYPAQGQPVYPRFSDAGYTTKDHGGRRAETFQSSYPANGLAHHSQQYRPDTEPWSVYQANYPQNVDVNNDQLQLVRQAPDLVSPGTHIGFSAPSRPIPQVRQSQDGAGYHMGNAQLEAAYLSPSRAQDDFVASEKTAVTLLAGFSSNWGNDSVHRAIFMSSSRNEIRDINMTEEHLMDVDIDARAIEFIVPDEDPMDVDSVSSSFEKSTRSASVQSLFPEFCARKSFNTQSDLVSNDICSFTRHESSLDVYEASFSRLKVKVSNFMEKTEKTLDHLRLPFLTFGSSFSRIVQPLSSVGCDIPREVEFPPSIEPQHPAPPVQGSSGQYLLRHYQPFSIEGLQSPAPPVQSSYRKDVQRRIRPSLINPPVTISHHLQAIDVDFITDGIRTLNLSDPGFSTPPSPTALPLHPQGNPCHLDLHSGIFNMNIAERHTPLAISSTSKAILDSEAIIPFQSTPAHGCIPAFTKLKDIFPLQISSIPDLFADDAFEFEDDEKGYWVSPIVIADAISLCDKTWFDLSIFSSTGPQLVEYLGQTAQDFQSSEAVAEVGSVEKSTTNVVCVEHGTFNAVDIETGCNQSTRPDEEIGIATANITYKDGVTTDVEGSGGVPTEFNQAIANNESSIQVISTVDCKLEQTRNIETRHRMFDSASVTPLTTTNITTLIRLTQGIERDSQHAAYTFKKKPFMDTRRRMRDRSAPKVILKAPTLRYFNFYFHLDANKPGIESKGVKAAAGVFSEVTNILKTSEISLSCPVKSYPRLLDSSRKLVTEPAPQTNKSECVVVNNSSFSTFLSGEDKIVEEVELPPAVLCEPLPPILRSCDKLNGEKVRVVKAKVHFVDETSLKEEVLPGALFVKDMMPQTPGLSFFSRLSPFFFGW